MDGASHLAMRLLGKDVTMVRFAGEGHELARSGSPIHRRQRIETILGFFDEHLKTIPSAPKHARTFPPDSSDGGR